MPDRMKRTICNSAFRNTLYERFSILMPRCSRQLQVPCRSPIEETSGHLAQIVAGGLEYARIVGAESNLLKQLPG